MVMATSESKPPIIPPITAPGTPKRRKPPVPPPITPRVLEATLKHTFAFSSSPSVR